MPTTSNFGWTTPADTDLVKDGAAAIRTLGNGIDTSFMDLKGGTTGQVLRKTTNADLDFEWGSVDPLTILDAKGDLITATAADTPARLPVGTNGQVLQADSTTSTGLKWGTAGGYWTELASGSLSGSQTDMTSISQSYRDLRIVITAYNKSANASSYFWVNADTGNYYVDANSPLAGDTAPGSSTTWSFSNTSTTNTNGILIFDFPEYTRTDVYKRVYMTGISENYTTAGRAQWKWAPFIYWRTTAISQFNISTNSGTHSGSFVILGGK